MARAAASTTIAALLSLAAACHEPVVSQRTPKASTTSRPTSNPRAAPVTSGTPVRASAQANAPAAASTIEASPPAASRAIDSPIRNLTWRYDDSVAGPMAVVVRVPATKERLPVVVAFHGMGESSKGPLRGARGWVDDYRLDAALKRVAEPPLNQKDMQGLADPKRLARINRSLERRRYRGLIVVCPYTPNILAPDRSLDGARSLSTFVVETLLPRVYRETPAIGDARSTSVDGVSLGGRAALLIGLEHPERFGAIAAIQPAIYPHELDELTRRFEAATAANPKVRLRLLTSVGDFYRGTIGKLARRLERSGIAHRHEVLPGPHDYAFNRGPGAYELLLFHDRALRGEPYL
jgi:enterochelin esterase-like enzyme